jgi:hypothetical protein
MLLSNFPGLFHLPVPTKLTVCGLPPPSSLTLSVAVRRPEAVGAKITLMVQLCPGLRLAVQVVVRVKSEGSVPVMVMAERFKGTVPLFVSAVTLAVLRDPTLMIP